MAGEGSGWYGESKRHSEAAIKGKGGHITTMERKVPFKSGTDLAAKVIYGDVHNLPTRMLQGKTEETNNIQELRGAVEAVEGYNKFKGTDVSNALQRLHEEGLIMSGSFGREGSPVLYVKIPYWTSQRTNYKRGGETERRLDPRERRIVMGRAMEILSTLKPDELDESITDYEIRAWWD